MVVVEQEVQKKAGLLLGTGRVRVEGTRDRGARLVLVDQCLNRFKVSISRPGIAQQVLPLRGPQFLKVRTLDCERAMAE